MGVESSQLKLTDFVKENNEQKLIFILKVYFIFIARNTHI